MKKITIIGSGSVGSTIAYTLMVMGLANEICMIDINSKKAYGEALDIQQGTPFCTPCRVYSGDYIDAKDSNIVIITSGIARKPGQTRLELAQTNVNILKSIAPQIVKAAPNALYIIVSNPVDVMTYVFHKISGLPENQIIGSGTVLDTARLRCGLSEHFGVAQKNVHAYVFGEHGDSSFVPWSSACISAIPVDEYPEVMKASGVDVEPIDKEAMIEYVRKSGGKIIANKGATFYAVSASVVQLCNVLLAASDSMASVSTMMHGEYGIEDVCMSTLALIGPNGYRGKVLINLTDEELAKMQASAEALKSVISQIEI
jgi:L-lactate dehydrogenase